MAFCLVCDRTDDHHEDCPLGGIPAYVFDHKIEEDAAMRKADEVLNNNSCLNKARADEMLFVLLARDPAAPDTIDFWIRERIERGLNNVNDPKLATAQRVAEEMRATQANFAST